MDEQNKVALVPSVQMPNQISLIHSEPEDRQMNQDAIASIMGNMMASLRKRKEELIEEEKKLNERKNKLFASIKTECDKHGKQLTKRDRPEVKSLVKVLKALGIKPQVAVTFNSVLTDFGPKEKKIIALSLAVTSESSGRYDNRTRTYNSVNISQTLYVEPPKSVIKLRAEHAILLDQYTNLRRELAGIEYKLAELPNNKIMIEGAVASANLSRTAKGQQVLDQATSLVSKWLDEKISSPKALGSGR